MQGVEASDKVVHDTVRYQMKAKLKVPRAVSVKHSSEAESEFKKMNPYLNTSIGASITGSDFILDALFVSGFS